MAQPKPRHEKRRTPIAATQFLTIVENAKLESAFLPIGKNTFSTIVRYGIVWHHHFTTPAMSNQSQFTCSSLSFCFCL